MTRETVIRHLVSLLATVICFLAFYSGYLAGGRQWWWVGFSVLIVYGGVYKIINAGH
ncbi:MAG: hypothetical protein HYV42_01585 [Candidatus Magasanikbacteria bacterium]|nr:hypothetical protein [Candidatus Magasanikbacteria bacterium]